MATAVRDLVEQGTVIFNKGDAEGFAALYADDVVVTTPDGRFEGRPSTVTYLQAFLDACPGVEVTLGRGCEQGDLYAGEYRVAGTNTGPLPMPDGSQMPATGKSFTLSAMEMVRVADGAIVQHDLVWDNMSFMVQLGLVPPA